MVATRSHHHSHTDRAGRVKKSDTLPTEKECRFDLASSIPGYAAWFKANRPDEYKEWLKTGASDRITTSTATQPTETPETGLECEIQGILKLRDVLCLPAPKVEAVVTVDLTALVRVYEVRSTPAVEKLSPFMVGFTVPTRNGRTGTIIRILSDGRRVIRINCPLLYWEYYHEADLLKIYQQEWGVMRAA